MTGNVLRLDNFRQEQVGDYVRLTGNDEHDAQVLSAMGFKQQHGNVWTSPTVDQSSVEEDAKPSLMSVLFNRVKQVGKNLPQSVSAAKETIAKEWKTIGTTAAIVGGTRWGLTALAGLTGAPVTASLAAITVTCGVVSGSLKTRAAWKKEQQRLLSLDAIAAAKRGELFGSQEEVAKTELSFREFMEQNKGLLSSNIFKGIASAALGGFIGSFAHYVPDILNGASDAVSDFMNTDQAVDASPSTTTELSDADRASIAQATPVAPAPQVVAPPASLSAPEVSQPVTAPAPVRVPAPVSAAPVAMPVAPPRASLITPDFLDRLPTDDAAPTGNANLLPADVPPAQRQSLGGRLVALFHYYVATPVGPGELACTPFVENGCSNDFIAQEGDIGAIKYYQAQVEIPMTEGQSLLEFQIEQAARPETFSRTHEMLRNINDAITNGTPVNDAVPAEYIGTVTETGEEFRGSAPVASAEFADASAAELPATDVGVLGVANDNVASQELLPIAVNEMPRALGLQ